MDTTFNPLEDLFFEDEGVDINNSVFEDSPYGMPNPQAMPKFLGELHSFSDKETAALRIEALFEQMPTLHGMLYDILAMCETPVPSDALMEHVAELKQSHHCIYDPSTLLDLLERAGAIQKTDADGVPLAAIEQEPLRVEIDGVAYWEVAPAPEVYWANTADGALKLNTYKPLELIQACIDEDPRYEEIYRTVLELCSREGGVSLSALADVVDDEPVLQNPKRFATFFVDKLERAGAVQWNGSWTIAQPGIDYLANLEVKEG